MSADPSARREPPVQGAPASLSAVKVRRERRLPGKSAKTGDLTTQLTAKAPKATKSSAPVIALPAPTPLTLLTPPTPTNRAPAASSTERDTPASAPDIIFAPAPEPEPAAPEATPSKPVENTAPTAPPPQAAAPVIALAPETTVPVTPAASRLESVSPPPRAAFASQRPHDNAELVNYWNEMRGAHRVPAFAMLDRERVASSWPDSLMVTYAENDAAMPQVKRLSKPTGDIEYSPMVTDWIISCARQVARVGEAMEDMQEFPLSGGVAGYHLLLLPFAAPQSKAMHVVCHLSRPHQERAARA